MSAVLHHVRMLHAACKSTALTHGMQWQPSRCCGLASTTTTRIFTPAYSDCPHLYTVDRLPCDVRIARGSKTAPECRRALQCVQRASPRLGAVPARRCSPRRRRGRQPAADKGRRRLLPAPRLHRTAVLAPALLCAPYIHAACHASLSARSGEIAAPTRQARAGWQRTA